MSQNINLNGNDGSMHRENSKFYHTVIHTALTATSTYSASKCCLQATVHDSARRRLVTLKYLNCLMK